MRESKRRGEALTVAACFVTPEGVVFGADSTTTAGTAGGNHYYDHSQKIFEIGTESTLAGVIWGLGGLPEASYRKLFANFGDKLKNNLPLSMADAAQKWIDHFWVAYSASTLIKLCCDLANKAPHIVGALIDPLVRTEEEEATLANLRRNLIAGFCIGGHIGTRDPKAFSAVFDPLAGKPSLQEVAGWNFWGTPTIVQRMIFGCDDNLKASLLSSGKWSGTPDELGELIAQHQFAYPIVLPMRDAVDFVHSSISATIKTLKFSNLSQTCGGPIELAVITADRPFRWVRHKTWDSAISDGGT
jgi:hypothetical protein